MAEDYCDVCGSPASAPDSGPAEAAASSALAARPGLTAVRRAVGVAAVLFRLACAVVFYRVAAPGYSTTGSAEATIQLKITQLSSPRTEEPNPHQEKMPEARK